MPIELVRRPRAARRQHAIVLAEVRKQYSVTAEGIIVRLLKDVAEWDGQPTFTYKVTVTRKKWEIKVEVDKSDKMGKIYDWVNKGTGTYGEGKGEYDIYPVNADALHFQVPNLPKTSPNVHGLGLGIVLQDYGEQADVFSKHVTHLGIQPREFTKSLYTFMKSTKPGAFRSATEAAIKRAFRQMGVYA